MESGNPQFAQHEHCEKTQAGSIQDKLERQDPLTIIEICFMGKFCSTKEAMVKELWIKPKPSLVLDWTY